MHPVLNNWHLPTWLFIPLQIGITGAALMAAFRITRTLPPLSTEIPALDRTLEGALVLVLLGIQIGILIWNPVPLTALVLTGTVPGTVFGIAFRAEDRSQQD